MTEYGEAGDGDKNRNTDTAVTVRRKTKNRITKTSVTMTVENGNRWCGDEVSIFSFFFEVFASC